MEPRPQSVGRVTRIPAAGVRSLLWRGDELVDLASGGVRYRLDGSSSSGGFQYAYSFDRATVSPSGEHSVLYVNEGTKGLVITRSGLPVREIDRSFYYANRYEYPVALASVDGKDLLIHCPDSYQRLEIEDAETGQSLSARPTKSRSETYDFFHSRLSVTPDNIYLVSSGWFWGATSSVMVYDLSEALARPELLDEGGLVSWSYSDLDGGEVGSVAYVGDDCLLVACYAEDPRDPEDQDLDAPTHMLGLWSIPDQTWLSKVTMREPIGTVMAIDRNRCVSLYRHPKLIDLSTGCVIASWPEIDSGTQVDSFVTLAMRVPPTALDSANRRFAIAGADAISVVEIDGDLSGQG